MQLWIYPCIRDVFCKTNENILLISSGQQLSQRGIIQGVANSEMYLWDWKRIRNLKTVKYGSLTFRRTWVAFLGFKMLLESKTAEQLILELQFATLGSGDFIKPISVWFFGWWGKRHILIIGCSLFPGVIKIKLRCIWPTLRYDSDLYTIGLKSNLCWPICIH